MKSSELINLILTELNCIDTLFVSGQADQKIGKGKKLTSGSQATSASCNCVPVQAAWRTPPDTGAVSYCHL